MLSSKRDLQDIAAWQALDMLRVAKLKPLDKRKLDQIRSRFKSTGAVTVAETAWMRELVWRHRKRIQEAQEAREAGLRSIARESSGLSSKEIRERAAKAYKKRKSDDDSFGF